MVLVVFERCCCADGWSGGLRMRKGKGKGNGTLPPFRFVIMHYPLASLKK